MQGKRGPDSARLTAAPLAALSRSPTALTNLQVCTESEDAQNTSADVSRPDVSIRQHTPACASMRQHTSGYVSIRQHTSRCRTALTNLHRASKEVVLSLLALLVQSTNTDTCPHQPASMRRICRRAGRVGACFRTCETHALNQAGQLTCRRHTATQFTCFTSTKADVSTTHNNTQLTC
jgi:hypothetical protein